MNYETIRIEGDGAIRHLVLDRRKIHNAVNRQLVEEITQACIALDRLQDVRVVILRGQGKSFCSGADLKADPMNSSETIDFSKAGARMIDLLTHLSPITIACLHGYCIGGGGVLPTACDFRLAAESTELTLNEVSIGYNLTWHTIPAVVQLVGPAKAKEMILLGHTYNAQQLAACGFVNEVLSDDDLLPRALELAQEICQQPPWPCFSTKASINAYAKALDRAVHHLDHVSSALMGHSKNGETARETYFTKQARHYIDE